MSEIMEISDNFILNDNAGISVGFKTEEAIKPFRALLEDLFSKQVFHNKQWAEKNQEFLKKQNSIIEDGNKSIQFAITENNKNNKIYNEILNSRISSLTDELKNGHKTRDAYLKTILNLTTKALDNYMKNSVQLSNIFRSIEEGGVFVKDGFDSLGQTAYRLGMTYEELANNLRKTAPLISRLNSSVGNGVKVFEDSLNGISKAYNLTHDEQVAAFESALENLTPSQLRTMSEQQLIARVDETARQMKLLSLATGKSVENIKQENSYKERTLRIQAYERAHPNEMKLMKALGMDDEMMDYFLSGGVKVTPKILMQMSNDPLRQAVFPEIMRLLQTNQFNNETLTKLQSQYGHLAQYKNDLALRSASNPSTYAPAAFSNLWEYATMDTTFGDNFTGLNLNDALNSYNSTARESSNRMLHNSQLYKERTNNFDTARQSLLTGGTEGMSNLFSIASAPYGIAGSAMNGIDSMLKNLGLNGLTSGILSGLAGMTIPAIGTYMGGRFGIGFGGDVRRFSKAVDKFSNSVGGRGMTTTIADEIFNKTLGKTKWGRKLSIISERPSLLFKGMTPTKMLARGAGGLGVGIAGGLLSNYIDEGTNEKLQSGQLNKNDTEYKVRTYGSSLISGASTGASLGAFFGIPGALIGAGIGGLIGIGTELYKQYKSNKEVEQSQLKPNEYSTISNKAVVNNNLNNNLEYNNYLKQTIELQKQTIEELRGINHTAEKSRIDNRLSGNQTPIIYSNAQEK